MLRGEKPTPAFAAPKHKKKNTLILWFIASK